MHEFEGTLDGRGLSLAVVVSRFNEQVVSGLLKGALSALSACGVEDDLISVVHVPGALELPLAAGRMVDAGHDAVIVLGAVIQGETDHYDFVCAGAMRGCAQLAEQTGVPVLLGLLTTANLGQALARAADDERNKGAEVARGAVAMATLCDQLDQHIDEHLDQLYDELDDSAGDDQPSDDPSCGDGEDDSADARRSDVPATEPGQ
ncbi:MAG: 6,7-dimethyl-8-ribityllumazine synthase [Planctomycetota bacterium]|nr:MAG: 6,7-dimethyl-8-ribityllumazine synthase [Planctomycetota bacterium]